MMKYAYLYASRTRKPDAGASSLIVQDVSILFAYRLSVFI
jgi:hypothetical protein